jgi:outer membrane receptor protein involved in Fe transport
MRRVFWIAAVTAGVVGAAQGPAMAQDTPAASTSAPVAGPETPPIVAEGVTVFPPAFFAAAQPNTAFDMLDRLPGFSFDGGDSSVRGFAGAGGNVLINGARPNSKSDNLEGQLRRIQAGQVERIELIRGGAPGIDMQGKTVLANVVLKKGSGLRGLTSLVLIQSEDGRFTPGVRIEGSKRQDGRSIELSYVISEYLSSDWGDGPRVRRTGDGRLDLASDIDTAAGGWQHYFNGAYERPLFGGTARATAFLIDNNYRLDFVERFRDGRAASRTENAQDDRRAEVGVRYEKPLSPTVSLEANVLQKLEEIPYESRSLTNGVEQVFVQDTTRGESIGRGVLRWRASDRLSFEGGAEAAFNFLDSTSALTEDERPVALPTSDIRVTETRAEAFGNGTWRVRDDLTLEAGARFETSTIKASRDADSEKTLFYAKPRAVLTWSPNPDNQFRLRIERELGQLDFNDFAASSELENDQVFAGNPDLVPEQTWVAEAAYERRFWGKGAVVLTVAHERITDVIDRAPVFTETSVFDGPANIGDATNSEVQLNVTLPLDRLGLANALLKAEMDWEWSEVTDPTTGETRRISGQAPFSGDYSFVQDLTRLSTTWGVTVSNGFYETYYRYNEITRVHYATYATLFAEWRARPNLQVRFEVQNVTARPVERHRKIYDGPRDRGVLVFEDDRSLNYDRAYYVRVRRTFG